MTLAFTRGLSRSHSRQLIAAPEPLNDAELTRARLARLQAATVARDPDRPASAPAVSLATGSDAAPWQESGFSITRAFAAKPLPVAAVLLLAVVVVAYAGWQHRGRTPERSPAPAAEITMVAQAGGEEPLPQDLAAMAAAPALAPKEAPGAVLRALAALSPVVVEPVSPVLPAGDTATPGNSSGWARTSAPDNAAEPVAAARASGWARAPESQQLPPARPLNLAAGQGGSHSQVPQAAQSVITWPAVGPLTSLYGPAHPLGIDIGIPFWTLLHAAAAGRVTFSGGDPCCSYGYFIDIDHGNGVMTRYGHLVQPSFLRPGQLVRLGDVIGYSGSTGYSTGPHVHFEIRLYGRPVDPLLVLP